MNDPRIVRDGTDDHDDTARFVIAGEGELRNELEGLAVRLGVARNVHFIGRCDDVPSLLASSYACVLTSSAEGFSNSILEYMPREMKLRGGTTKWILREAMKGILPAEILDRPKMGFPVPIGGWFRGEFKYIVDEYVLGERAMSRRIFDESFVRGIVTRHNAGENHDERLWSLVNFEMWQRQFIDGEASK